MPKTPFDKVVDGIKAIARQEILKDFRLDSCIGSTRTVIRVLKHFGYEAQPFPCRAFIYNPAFVKAIERGERPPEDTIARSQWMDNMGAWSVGVGFQPDDAVKYVGHLAAVLPERKLLIDASLDQANRPHKNILIPPVVVAKVTDEFLRSEDVVEYGVNGMRVVYEPRPEDRAWRESTNWNNSSQTKRAMKAIIKYIEERS